MRTQSPWFRLSATVAVSALLLAQAQPPRALAQGAPPPQQAAPPDQQTGDPPQRVGRLAQITGTVSFHTQDEDQWNRATLNYPVVQGNSFWTELNARAVIEVSASRVAMAPGTELSVGTLTDTAFQAIEPQGELYFRVRAATPDETYAVQTPRGVVTLQSPGRYDVVAGDTQNPTLVTVVDGAAHIEAPGLTLDVAASQTASITGSDSFEGQVGPAQRDAFLTAMLDSERPPPTQGVAPPPAVAAMPGGGELAEYGTWVDSPQYGQVWYPQVAPDWVPYRDGRWAYAEPWGWTWVDAAPWGFAPFHYGRWAFVGSRWCWAPGVFVGPPHPVFAPALVTFVGVGAAVGIGIGAALAAGSIGWVPLGPREPFHPWYRASNNYFRQVNVAHVTNITNVTNINRNVTINNFVNRQATTVVPTTVMTASRPVGGAFQRMDPARLAAARPVIGQQPLRPAATTIGVTPAVARQLNLPPGSPALHAVAPGPAIQPAAPGAVPGAAPGVTMGARQGFPALHNPAAPGSTLPAAAGAVRPLTATPGLRPPPVPGQGGPPAITHEPGLAGTGAGPGAHPPALATPGAGAIAPQLHTGPVGQGAAVHLPPGGGAPPPNSLPQLHAAPGAVVQQPPPAFHQGVPAAHLPPPVAVVPPPAAVQQFHAPPAAAVQRPIPPAAFHPPAPVVNTPPPAAFHPPAPTVNAPPPAAFHPPPPAFHPPVANVAPPAAAFHPPPAAPQVHAPPPPQNSQQHKKPGEP
jgi:hypothetical protein